jgi:3-vinyl bacteriochlorophyllide hydratase
VCLITRFMVTGEGEMLAVWSVVFKTLVLYAIMVTGSIWEKVVFDKWLFAESFFWEDVFSFLVLGLHTAYLWSLYTGNMSRREQMFLALTAYAVYAINAAQFLWKLKAARIQERATIALQRELAA